MLSYSASTPTNSKAFFDILTHKHAGWPASEQKKEGASASRGWWCPLSCTPQYKSEYKNGR